MFVLIVCSLFQLRCCGAHGIADFSELSIPWSCYNRPEPGTAARQILYDRGCLSVLVDDIKWQLLCVAFCAMVLCLFQVRRMLCLVVLKINSNGVIFISVDLWNLLHVASYAIAKGMLLILLPSSVME